MAGADVYIIGGLTSNDQVQIKPIGSSNTGSTGVQVTATLNGTSTTTTFRQAFSAIQVFGFAGNDTINLAATLTISANISAGNGNDNVTAGSGSNTIMLGNGNDNITTGGGLNTITLGDGNDNVTAGNGSNTVALGNGNDNVAAGNGSNTVTLGNGNDTIKVGNGDNVVVEGNGNDTITAGNGSNLIVAGLGQHTVHAGNGSNILIDGSVKLTQGGDSLRQVLDDWALHGGVAAECRRHTFALGRNLQQQPRQHIGCRHRPRLVLGEVRQGFDESQSDRLARLMSSVFLKTPNPTSWWRRANRWTCCGTTATARSERLRWSPLRAVMSSSTTYTDDGSISSW